MIVKKLNLKNNEFEEVNIPDEWEIVSNVDNLPIRMLEKTMNCVNCGCKVRLGSTYKSYVYFDEENEKYHICGDCNFKEEKEYLETLSPNKRKIKEIENKIWYIENKDTLEYDESSELSRLYKELRTLKEKENYEITKNNNKR